MLWKIKEISVTTVTAVLAPQPPVSVGAKQT